MPDGGPESFRSRLIIILDGFTTLLPCPGLYLSDHHSRTPLGLPVPSCCPIGQKDPTGLLQVYSTLTLMGKVERFPLDTLSLTSTHGKGSGTSLLKRGWTLYHSVFVNSERQAGVVIIVAPPARCLYVGVYLTE